MAELTDNVIQLFCVFICGIYSLVKAITKRNYRWLLITLFYLSFGIGLTYWVLYLVLFQSTPRVFFISELNWLASYIFLAIRLAVDITEEERQYKSQWFFFVLPTFSLIMCAFFCLRQSYLENISMGAAMAVCGFYGVKGIYLSKQKHATSRLWIFSAVLIFYMAEYLLWISSYFGIGNTFLNPYFLVDTFILNPAIVLIAFAQSKEDKICPII